MTDATLSARNMAMSASVGWFVRVDERSGWEGTNVNCCAVRLGAMECVFARRVSNAFPVTRGCLDESIRLVWVMAPWQSE